MILVTGDTLTLKCKRKDTYAPMPSEDKPFVCEYCGKGYTREKTLLAHMCEKKRRHLQKDEKRVRFGHYVFNVL